MKISHTLLLLILFQSIFITSINHKKQQKKGFLSLSKENKEKKPEKLALNDLRFRLVIGFLNEIDLDVHNIESMNDPLQKVRHLINKNQGFICILADKIYNMNRFLQLASRLVVNDHSEYFQDINEEELKKVQSSYGQFQKSFEEIIEQGVNTLCHINIDDESQRFDEDLKDSIKQMKQDQLKLMEGLLVLFKDLVENEFPNDKSTKIIECPKLLESIKEQKELWMTRNLDGHTYSHFAELVNDVYQPLMNQVEDVAIHSQWDNTIQTFFVQLCQYYYVFSQQHVHMVTLKKNSLLFLQQFKLLIQSSLLFVEKEVVDLQKVKKFTQFYLYSSAILLAGTQVPFWTDIFSNNLHPVDQNEHETEIIDQQNHMNLFYKAQQLLIEFQEPLSYMKSLYKLMEESEFLERKELKMVDYANGIKDFEVFCETSVLFCSNILFQNNELLRIFQELKPTIIMKLIKQAESAPISDVQVSDDEEEEKYLLFYGYKKVNEQIHGSNIFYCRGCIGPYFITDIELKTGTLTEMLAEVTPEGNNNIRVYEKIGEDTVLFIEKVLKREYNPKKQKVLAEIIAEQPGHEIWVEKDKAEDTQKGIYFFMQEYNTAKSFYEHEFILFHSYFHFQFDFQHQQILVLAEGPQECQHSIIEHEFQNGIRMIDQFKDFDVYTYNQMDHNSTDFQDTDHIISRYTTNYTCTNVLVIKLLDNKFGQVSLITKEQKEQMAKENRADIQFFKIPEFDDEYILYKLYPDYKSSSKNNKEYIISDLEKSLEKISGSGITQNSIEEDLCKPVKEKGTPFLDNDPDEYLKYFVGKEAAFPEGSEELNFNKQVEEVADFDCEKQHKKLPILKDHNFEEIELIFGNIIQGKMEGLLSDIIKESAVNKCMLGKVYEIKSSCKENILYLTRIDGSKIIEEICVGTDISPEKLLSMPKDDLVPIEKKYYLQISMESLELPENQYEFNKKFGGYMPATWLEIEPIHIQDPEIKKKVKLYIQFWIKTDPFNHNFIGFIDEYNNYDKCLKVNNNFNRETQIKEPNMDPIIFNIKSALANSAGPLVLQSIIDQFGIGQSLTERAKIKKMLKANQCKFSKIYIPIYYKGKSGSSCDVIDPQFIVKSLFFSAETGVNEVCDGINFSISDVYYMEIIIYEDAVGDDAELDMLIAKRQGYVSVQKHRKYSVADNGYTLEVRIWAKPALQIIHMKSLICD